jgi:hypothetical protein
LRSAQGLAVRAALLCALLASVGCFRPKILPGGFRCGDGGNPCPDSFTCDKSIGSCIPNGSDAGAPTGGTGGKGGQGGKGGTAGRDAGVDKPVDRPCTAQVANCRPPDGGTTGMCDPVCNTGCGECHEKCSVNSSGALTCNEPMGTPTGLFGTCGQTNFGAIQTDNCQPGQLCVAKNTCSTTGECYQFCRTNADCSGGASCSRDAGGGYSFCDVSPFACDPVVGAAKTNSGCPGGQFVGCYLSASTNSTLCDCQFTSSGSAGAIHSSCTQSRDCFAGLICIDPTGHDNKTCLKVCRLPGDGGVDLTRKDAGEGECTDLSLCSPIALANGTTNPTYGVCNE